MRYVFTVDIFGFIFRGNSETVFVLRRLQYPLNDDIIKSKNRKIILANFKFAVKCFFIVCRKKEVSPFGIFLYNQLEERGSS